MGIPGLTTYMSERSDMYFRPHELKDTYLVLDGYNISSHILQWHMKTMSAFGGDYDVYYFVVKEFFLNLRKCGIVPIVIFDGGYERKKLKTIHKRCNDKMLLLRNFRRECWSGVFFPLLMHEVFNDVLEELEIIHVQCFFEADNEIAAVARYLNCPVLSYDSDFYIYDVFYIPFNTLRLEPKQAENNMYYMECYIYHSSRFLELEGIDKSLLPLMAALLGNDYADSDIFGKFFHHVIFPNTSKISKSQRKIHGVIDWLKSETLESAKELVLSHLEKLNVDRALRIINATIEDYKMASPSFLQLLQIENKCNSEKVMEVSSDNFVMMENKNLILKLPQKFIELFNNCKLSGFMIDIMHLHRYYMPFQVEDVNQASSHFISVPIISAIHKILNSFIGASNPLDLYTKLIQKYSKTRLAHCANPYFIGVNMKNLLNEPNPVKQNIVNRILDLDENDIKVLKIFNNDWILFMMSLIYWLKNSKVSCSHIYALLLMALANFVQTHVGYYRNYSSFMRHKAGTINRLSKDKVDVAKTDGSLFSNYLASISKTEFLLFTQKFIKMRQTCNEVTKKGYFITTIHLFASFQSCVYHLIQLNSLLDFPFLELEVAKFYSGTFLYNMYYLLNEQKNNMAFIQNLLKDTPNILNIYMFLVNSVSRYIPEIHEKERRRLLENKGSGTRRRRK